MKILRRIYSTYCLLVFAGIFLLLLPFFLLVIQKEQWHFYAYKLNYVWARVFYFLCGFPFEQIYEAPIDKNKQYIFCSNHTSFLDITLLGLTPNYFIFVGKSSISKVPLFGYMYRKLHITVDRNNLKSRYEIIKRAHEAIDNGKSLVIFPEGGIYSDHPPEMSKFKDGPFRIAIEKQVPIVPITIPYNWMILPDDGKLLVHWRKAKIIYHKPVSTQGMTLADIDRLKHIVYNCIHDELSKYFKLTTKGEVGTEEVKVGSGS